MGKYLKYKGITVNAFGIPVPDPWKTHQARQGVKGRKYYQFRCFTYNFKNTAPKDLVVMYDIPENKKKEREWFRRQLQKFDYIMIQRSVWVGPSPLPKEFLDYVKKIGLSGQMRTLKLAKPYSKGDRNM
jgi:hypothetical protein